jgi:hypothetical protein
MAINDSASDTPVSKRKTKTAVSRTNKEINGKTQTSKTFANIGSSPALPSHGAGELSRN